MAKAIAATKISDLIRSLKRKYDVFAPQKKEGEIIFAPVDNPKEAILNYETAVLPPKQFFLPPEEELFTVKKEAVTEQKAPKPFVLFGLNIKDLEAICYLDQIMSKEPADSPYLEKRKKAVLITVSETAVGTPPGGDLMLEKVGSVYKATALTPAGKKIASSPLFKEKKATNPKPAKKPTKLEEMLLDAELLARAVEWSRENYQEIWERLGKQCITCGICTYVCPLCYCFEMEDKTSLDGSICTRCRQWSACTLPSFSTVAGGHNFRPTIKDRYYNWYHHKFVRAYKEFGRAQCVACGRCQKYCPAGINIEEVLTEIIEKFKEANPERTF